MKCGTRTCEADALYRAFWPGDKPLPVCRACALLAAHVADAMGFNLAIDPIDSSTPLLTDPLLSVVVIPGRREPS